VQRNSNTGLKESHQLHGNENTPCASVRGHSSNIFNLCCSFSKPCLPDIYPNYFLIHTLFSPIHLFILFFHPSIRTLCSSIRGPSCFLAVQGASRPLNAKGGRVQGSSTHTYTHTHTHSQGASRTLNAKEVVCRGAALQCAMLSPVFKVK